MARAAAILIVAACAFLATACTAGHPAQVRTGAGTSAPPSPSASASVAADPRPVRGAAYTSGGCGATPLLRGPAPNWASSANPPAIRYALAERGQVAGFLVGYPLMAGNPQPYSDKVLWVAASPRDGQPLRLTGSSARCGYARRVVHLASGFDARGNLPVGDHSPIARLLAV